ncbi:MAG: ABC transporter ATP-binding protein [Chloroflexi bacterium]|nr:ABC transporter ATP-binding protein [Chloroflexota bacterium]
MPEPVLSARHLSHAFTTVDGQVVETLHDVSLALHRGTFTCLVGPSGSGKTTLLRLLAGLARPMQGEVYLDGAPLKRPQRRISLVFQRDNLMPWRTVYRNIALPLQLAGVNQKHQRGRIEALITLTGLAGFEEAFPAELSGGMAQRVAIARGLVTNPDILLLDEPFGALDAMTREQLWGELLAIWENTQAAVLMVTHDIREAVFLSDQVLVMSQRPGRLIADIDVPFSRPRSLGLLADHAFINREANVRTALQR